jgi:nucleoid-associated protein YgaU
MAEDLFQQLKEKYVSVLSVINRENLNVKNLHLQDNKLVIRAEAPTQDAKNKFWEAVKKVDASFKDLMADISVAPAAAPQAKPAAAPAAPAPAAPAAQTYTVVGGDTLSKIAKHFYGNANDYMKIFEANRDKLSDPDKIQIGQVLKIPPK